MCKDLELGKLPPILKPVESLEVVIWFQVQVCDQILQK